MADVVQLFNPNGDLEKPVWFYQRVEALADDAFDSIGDALEACPFGELTYDHLYGAIADTPVRLMALADGDVELDNHIVINAVARLWMEVCSGERLSFGP